MREGSGAGTGPPELMPNRACINGTQPAGPQAAHRLPVLLTGASMHCSPMPLEPAAVRRRARAPAGRACPMSRVAIICRPPPRAQWCRRTLARPVTWFRASQKGTIACPRQGGGTLVFLSSTSQSMETSQTGTIVLPAGRAPHWLPTRLQACAPGAPTQHQTRLWRGMSSTHACRAGARPAGPPRAWKRARPNVKL